MLLKTDNCSRSLAISLLSSLVFLSLILYLSHRIFYELMIKVMFFSERS